MCDMRCALDLAVGLFDSFGTDDGYYLIGTIVVVIGSSVAEQNIYHYVFFLNLTSLANYKIFESLGRLIGKIQIDVDLKFNFGLFNELKFKLIHYSSQNNNYIKCMILVYCHFVCSLNIVGYFLILCSKL